MNCARQKFLKFFNSSLKILKILTLLFVDRNSVEYQLYKSTTMAGAILNKITHALYINKERLAKIIFWQVKAHDLLKADRYFFVCNKCKMDTP